MKSPFIVGDKIYLRALEREDAVLCRDFVNDPDVRRCLDQYRPKNIPFEEAWIAGQASDPSTIVFGIALKENDRLIGCADLRAIHLVNRHANFGIAIGAKDLWHQGHGTEATRLVVAYGFDVLNLNRIDLDVYETNPHAIRAYQKAGFVREGTLRQHVFRNGRYLDAHIMGILREDFEKNRR